MKTILPYDQTLFRVSENYLMPDADVGGLSRARFEQTLARNGVESRWVGVYDHGGPRFRSAFIPISSRVPGDLTAKLKRQIALIHAGGMAAITWCSPYCESAWKAHRSWRIVYMDRRDPGPKAACCINSPYGDALIGMMLEFFANFGLDGLFFDGANFGAALRPSPPCVCTHCRKKFAAETGLPLPTSVDFGSRTFRAWVHWRFTMYAAYLKKMVDTLHAHYPDKTIVINHYHRYSPHAWHTACPLDTYDCSIVTASEAMMHMDHTSMSAKIAVAYGRKADIWTPVARWRMGSQWQIHEPKALLHHAACCLSFGAIPSFGYETDVPKGSVPASVQSFLRPMAEFLRQRARYAELPSANPVALHLSQQTETFYFGRRTADHKGFGWYWESLFGWDQLLNETGLGTDIVFDRHLTAGRLARYKAVVLPLSLALSAAQARALREYVSAGGVLVLGPWAGSLDEDGETTAHPPLGKLRAVNEAAAPEANAFRRNSLYFTKHLPALPDLHGFAMHTMLARQTPRKGSAVLMTCDGIGREDDGLDLMYPATGKTGRDTLAGVTRRNYGRGFVIDLAGDWGASFYYAPSSPLRRMLMSVLGDTADFPLRVQAPPCVTVAWRHEKDGACILHLHNCPVTTHHQGHEAGDYYMPIIPRDVIPVTDIRIEAKGDAPLQATRLVEAPGPLRVRRKGNHSVIDVGKLALHEIIRIRYPEA
ncbi:MAG: beta-galactosidase trimerization domain-containing protein [Lentisphaeria bacterium]